MSYRKLPGINNITDSDTFIDTGTPGNRAGAGLSFVPGKEVTAVVLDSNDSAWVLRGGFNTNGGEVIFDDGDKVVIKLAGSTPSALAVPTNLVLDNDENVWVFGTLGDEICLWRIDKNTLESSLIVNTGFPPSPNGSGGITYDAVRGAVWISYYDNVQNIGVAKKYSDTTFSLLATVDLDDSVPNAMEWASSPDALWIFTNVTGFTTTVWRINTTTNVVTFSVPSFSSDWIRNSYYDGNVGLMITLQNNEIIKIDMSDGSVLDSLNLSYNGTSARVGPMVAISGTEVDLWVMARDRDTNTFYMQLILGADTGSLSVSPVKIEIPTGNFVTKIAVGNYAIGCCCCICVCCCCCCIPSYGTLVIPIDLQDQVLQISVNQNGARSSRTSDYSTFLGYAGGVFPASEEFAISTGRFVNNEPDSTLTIGARTFNFYKFPESILSMDRRARLFITISFNNDGGAEGVIELINNDNDEVIIDQTFTNDTSITEFILPLEIENSPETSVVSGVLYRLDLTMNGGGELPEFVCYSARLVVDYV